MDRSRNQTKQLQLAYIDQLKKLSFMLLFTFSKHTQNGPHAKIRNRRRTLYIQLKTTENMD